MKMRMPNLLPIPILTERVNSMDSTIRTIGECLKPSVHLVEKVEIMLPIIFILVDIGEFIPALESGMLKSNTMERKL